MSEEVIELSVVETNALRAKLGLKPLRISDEPQQQQQQRSPPPQDNAPRNGQEEVLELSVSETNALREKLGLPPLRETSSSSSSTRQIHDANLQEKEDAKRRHEAEEQARLKRQVQKGTEQFTKNKSLGQEDAPGGALDWAAKMRQQQQQQQPTEPVEISTAKKTPKKKNKKAKHKDSNHHGTTANDKYNQEDLKGIQVAHAVSELEAGSTTVMTLADAPLLETDEHHHRVVKGLNDNDAPQLENVNLAEAAQQSDGLRRKRQFEMGMGRAGGYAGFDDDEFVELGGSSGPSRLARGQQLQDDADGHRHRRRGFQIGGDGADADDGAKRNNDVFAAHKGRAISLEPSRADVLASDFMTEQEEMELRELEALSKPTITKVKSEKKKKSKKKKENEKQRKKQRKEQKKHLRRREDDSSDDEASENDGGKPEVVGGETQRSKSLLDELEETAHGATENKKSKTRKRARREDDDDDDDVDKVDDGIKREMALTAIPSASLKHQESTAQESKNDNKDKRARYDEIMAKGNARTEKAFEAKKSSKPFDDEDDNDGEPDDAFLNAALAKARRMNKLRQMTGSSQVASATVGAAEAVVEAVKSMPQPDYSMSDGNGANAGVTFSVDDTREFTRALRARTEQKQRQQSKAATKPAPANSISTVAAPLVNQESREAAPNVTTVMQEGGEDDGVDDMDMSELAKEMKDDEPGPGSVAGGFLDGSTGNTVPVGRGLANVMNLWKHTGELTRKNAGKEELRGRAKDERTYEDYEALDLQRVVKIDESRATDKDKEFARREVKLEYRDKHGRLLTRKEAFRDLCYQFHGHGSSKRKEEKRQKQVAREQAESRLASQHVAGGPGTFGALKKTQKATGKAFVIHKT